MVVPINSTWLISSVPTPCKRSLYGLDVASPRKLMLWNRYCIIVRISPNWPPGRSCRAFAAAGSGSLTTISLMSCWVWKYISLLEALSLCAGNRHPGLFFGYRRTGLLGVRFRAPAGGANRPTGVIAGAAQPGAESDHGQTGVLNFAI